MSKLETRPARPNGESAQDLIARLFPQNGERLPRQNSLASQDQSLVVVTGQSTPNGSPEHSVPLNEPTDTTTQTDPELDNTALYFRDITRVPLLTAEQEVQLAQQLEAGRAARAQLLLADQLIVDTEVLEETARQGDEARKRMIESNLRLVVAVARGYQGLGLSLLDMAQEGSIGLQRAAEKFDWRRGFRFSTYAYWWIRQAVTRGIAEQVRTIRLPVHQTDLLRMLNNVYRDLSQQLGREPTDEELAEISGLSLDRVEELHRVSQFTGSLDLPANPEGDPLGDLVPDTYSPTPEEEAEQTLLRDYIDEALQSLPPREQATIRLRFGLDGTREHTLAEVAAEQNLSRERIRQIEREALGKLRHSRVRLKLREYIE